MRIYRVPFCNIVLVLLILLSNLPAKATIKIKSLRTPIPLVFSNFCHSEISSVDDKVILTIPETLLYKDYLINKGTNFIFEIEKNRKSKRFGRIGYLKLKLKNISWNDEEIKANKLYKKPIYINVYHQKKMKRVNRSRGRKIAQTSFIIGAVFCPIPGSTLPFNLYEEFQDNKEKGFFHKTGSAVLRTTGLPGLINLLRTPKSPKYLPQETIQIKFKPKFLRNCFTLTPNTIPDIQTEPPQIELDVHGEVHTET